MTQNQTDQTFTAANQEVHLMIQELNTLAVQVSGTFNATIVIEATIDGQNWFTVTLTDLADGSQDTSITAPGKWRADISAYADVRARCSAYTSGSALVALRAVQGGASTGSSTSSSSSASVGGGSSVYSNVFGDFTATANNGAKTITLSAYASTVLSSVIANINFLNAVIKRRNSSGVVDTLPLTNVSFAANVLTLSDMAANFAAGDTVAVFVQGPYKGYDEANDWLKTSMQTAIAGEDITNDRLKVEQRYTPFSISTATTTTVKSGAGYVDEILVVGGTLGNVTIYDNTAASGTVLLPTVTPVQNGILLRHVTFGTGLTIVTAAATIIVGGYR